MALSFKQYEIDHHVLKLIVGLIALSLANRALPVITAHDERVALLPFTKGATEAR
jgi:hypothetical protein